MDDLKIIPNFTNYVFDCQKIKIINRRTKKVLKPRAKTKNRIFYRLYDSGISQDLSLFDILRLVFSKK